MSPLSPKLEYYTMALPSGNRLRLVFALLAITITGCATTSDLSGTLPAESAFQHDDAQSNIASLLDYHYAEWKGTPHRRGGTGNRGVDCSAFVYLTFKDLFGLELPRTTRAQSKVGNAVKGKNLRTGDLVFFKTGFRRRHVGIYLGDRNFIHASTSQGVMKSSLDSEYWAKHYWKSVRIPRN